MAASKHSPLDEYLELMEKQKQQALNEEALQRLELLRDVLLEVGALPEKAGSQARAPRAEVTLEVTFQTHADVTRAYSRNIGTGGIAIQTSKPLPVGSAVELLVVLPGSPTPLTTVGTVAWCHRDVMGIAFGEVARPQADLLKRLLMEDATVLNRIRQALSQRAPTPVEAVEVDRRPQILLKLSDERLLQVTGEILAQQGLRAVTAREERRAAPVMVVAEPPFALEAHRQMPKAPLVLVGASGPDALAGKLSMLTPSAYVRRPVSAAALVETVQRLLQQPVRTGRE